MAYHEACRDIPEVGADRTLIPVGQLIESVMELNTCVMNSVPHSITQLQKVTDSFEVLQGCSLVLFHQTKMIIRTCRYNLLPTPVTCTEGEFLAMPTIIILIAECIT